MSSKNYYENAFANYSEDTCRHFVNASKNTVTIADEFHTRVRDFKSEKLLLLMTKLEKEIFRNETVYTGSAGMALYYLICSFNKNESSEEMLKQALKYIDVNTLKGKRISFLCGDAGPLAIATVISYKLGNLRPDNLPEYKNLAKRLENLNSLIDDSPNELLYGRVGYLYALLFVKIYTNDHNLIPVHLIEQVSTRIIKSGRKLSQKMKSESPLLWQWHDKVYFGAAHGLAGILYILLVSHSHISEDDIRNLIKPTLNWLLNHQFPSGNFPSSQGSSSGDRLVQWCHGAPGFVPLCLLAYDIFKEEKYLEIALECGEVIWQRGLCKKGYSICHGVSGNAYAFLQIFQTTKDPLHLYRACCFMEWCMLERADKEQHHPDRPASLFEGLLGRVFLASAIVNPTEAKFPAFCF